MAFRVVWTFYKNVVKAVIESTWFLSHILLFMYVAMETASNDANHLEHKTSQFLN